MTQESEIKIKLVHGGYILTAPTNGAEGNKTEVYTSHGKLMKAIRGAIDEFSLVAKRTSDTEGSED